MKRAAKAPTDASKQAKPLPPPTLEKNQKTFPFDTRELPKLSETTYVDNYRITVRDVGVSVPERS